MNILIIDDEPLIAQTVYAQLVEMDTAGDRYDIALGVAEAKEKLEKVEYEIFLCDIVMPEENGISFAKWVLENRPDTKIIFLTAHADFDYMKEAIRMRSFDYILQPVERTELKRAVERAKSAFTIEKKHKELVRTGAFFQDKEMNILEDNALRFLQKLTGQDAYLRRFMEIRLEKERPDARYLLFVVQVLETGYRWKESERSLLREVYYNILEEIMEPLQREFVLLLNGNPDGGFLVILRPGEKDMPGLSEVKKMLETMRYMFENVLKTNIAVYYGDYCGFEELPEQFAAIGAMRQDNVQDAGRIIHIGEGRSGISGYSFDLQRASWQAMLKKNRLNEFKDSILRYLSHSIAGNKVDQDFMMELHQAMSELLFSYMSANNIRSSDVFDEELSYYDFLYCYYHVKDFSAILGRVVQKLCGHVEMMDEDAVRGLIRYIDQHLDEDISVSSIADLVGLNQDYLTRMFKKNTGLSLKRYIVNQKMEAAKNLLVTTNLSVTLICERVGYVNYSNFIRAFRQIVGCTPSEYRKMKESGLSDSRKI